MYQFLRKCGIVVLLFLFACFSPVLHAQEEDRLQIVDVDISAFPVVRVTLMTADSRSSPADLSNLALRENGIPVTEFTFDNVPVGIDAIFVLDANTGFEELDDESGLSRQEKVRDSITRFANEYMNQDGLDHISIIVPGDGGQSGQFLIQNETDPAQVVDAISNYNPARLGPTPLNAMLNLAIEQAQQQGEDARFQAVMLFSDGRRLDQQLSYPLLIAQANDSNIPIFGAILGSSADENEIANMMRLTEPTRAFQLHMPQPTAIDSIYQIWQQQGNPVQVAYTSRQRQSGRNQIAVNLGTTSAGSSFDVSLAAPEIALILPNDAIRRVGTGPDSALDTLQPQFQPVKVNITWPDGLPRKLIELILLANNRPQQITNEWQENAQGQIELTWDIRSIDPGTVELVVQAIDELGYQDSTIPQSVEITVDRPLPPTAVPTAIPQETAPEALPTAKNEWTLIAGVIVLLLLAITAFVWYWRRRAKEKTISTSPISSAAEIEPVSSSIDPPKVAILEPLNSQSGEVIILDGSSFTIGSDAHSVQIVLNDVSVSRLHARIRRQDQTYWLFDEGSAEGLFLNYERIGLAPRELHDGDIVQFGRLAFRFILRVSTDS